MNVDVKYVVGAFAVSVASAVVALAMWTRPPIEISDGAFEFAKVEGKSLALIANYCLVSEPPLFIGIYAVEGERSYNLAQRIVSKRHSVLSCGVVETVYSGVFKFLPPGRYKVYAEAFFGDVGVDLISYDVAEFELEIQ